MEQNLEQERQLTQQERVRKTTIMGTTVTLRVNLALIIEPDGFATHPTQLLNRDEIGTGQMAGIKPRQIG